MQTFLPFIFLFARRRALVAACVLCANVGIAQTQTPCTPTTVQTVTVTPLMGCHPGQYEVSINALAQYNTYYAYLYAAGSTTPYASVEVLGTFFDLEVFGTRPAGAYTLTVVPVSSNMGALTQYALTSATFNLVAARLANQPQVLSCAGVIDNNVITSDAPPTVPCVLSLSENIASFNANILGGTDPKNEFLRTAAIRNVTTAACLTDFAYQRYLYGKINANYQLRFRYKNELSARSMKAFDITVDRAKLGLPMPAPAIPDYNSDDFRKFVAAIEGLLKDKLKPLLPEPSKYLSITVSGL